MFFIISTLTRGTHSLGHCWIFLDRPVRLATARNRFDGVVVLEIFRPHAHVLDAYNASAPRQRPQARCGQMRRHVAVGSTRINLPSFRERLDIEHVALGASRSTQRIDIYPTITIQIPVQAFITRWIVRTLWSAYTKSPFFTLHRHQFPVARLTVMVDAKAAYLGGQLYRGIAIAANDVALLRSRTAVATEQVIYIV